MIHNYFEYPIYSCILALLRNKGYNFKNEMSMKKIIDWN